MEIGFSSSPPPCCFWFLVNDDSDTILHVSSDIFQVVGMDLAAPIHAEEYVGHSAHLFFHPDGVAAVKRLLSRDRREEGEAKRQRSLPWRALFAAFDPKSFLPLGDYQRMQIITYPIASARLYVVHRVASKRTSRSQFCRAPTFTFEDLCALLKAYSQTTSLANHLEIIVGRHPLIASPELHTLLPPERAELLSSLASASPPQQPCDSVCICRSHKHGKFEVQSRYIILGNFVLAEHNLSVSGRPILGRGRSSPGPPTLWPYSGAFIFHELLIYVSGLCGVSINSTAFNAFFSDAVVHAFPPNFLPEAASLILSRRWYRRLGKLVGELADELGDARLYHALSAGRQKIQSAISELLRSTMYCSTLLRLDKAAVRDLTHLIHRVIDQSVLNPAENTRARLFVMELTETVPEPLLLTNIVDCEDVPRFGGGFGDIYRAWLGGRPVALKQLRTFALGCSYDEDRMKRQLLRELKIWQHLQHKFVLPLFGVSQDCFPGLVVLVSPWMERGTIISYLRSANYGPDRVRLLSEIAQGLQYLHGSSVVHGDLRGANILISDDRHACLADFGLGAFNDASATASTQARAGSVFWMAPELIDPNQFNLPFRRTFSTDVYAFACVCIEVFTLETPFKPLREAEVILRVTARGERPRRPWEMSDALWELLESCWAQLAHERPDTDFIVQRLSLCTLLDALWSETPRLSRSDPVKFPCRGVFG